MASPRTRFGAELEIPGPGAYSHSTDQTASGFLGDAPCYSMGARKSVPRPDDASPGPIYSPRILTADSTGPMGDAEQYSFGSSKRFESGASYNPGPGQYEAVSTRIGGSLIGDAAKYGFGTSIQRPTSQHGKGQRFISKEHATKSNYAQASPGPLAYKQQETLGSQLVGTGVANSPRYTIRPRLDSYQPNGTASGSGSDRPGPGKYNQSMSIGNQVASTRNTAASFSFGTSERHRPEVSPGKTAYIGKDFERQNWGERATPVCR